MQSLKDQLMKQLGRINERILAPDALAGDIEHLALSEQALIQALLALEESADDPVFGPQYMQ